MHTNAHADQLVEFGHLLSSSDLAQSDAVFDGTSYVNSSSLRHLASKPGMTLSTLVRGSMSLGGMMMARESRRRSEEGACW